MLAASRPQAAARKTVIQEDRCVEARGIFLSGGCKRLLVFGFILDAINRELSSRPLLRQTWLLWKGPSSPRHAAPGEGTACTARWPGCRPWRESNRRSDPRVSVGSTTSLGAGANRPRGRPLLHRTRPIPQPSSPPNIRVAPRRHARDSRRTRGSDAIFLAPSMQRRSQSSVAPHAWTLDGRTPREKRPACP